MVNSCGPSSSRFSSYLHVCTVAEATPAHKQISIKKLKSCFSRHFTIIKLKHIFEWWHLAKASNIKETCDLQVPTLGSPVSLPTFSFLSTTSGPVPRGSWVQTVPGPRCPPVTPVCCCLFQKLSGRKINPVLRMFGQSISGGIDMDGNGYPGKLFFSKQAR